MITDVRQSIFHHEMFESRGSGTSFTLEGIRSEQRTWAFAAAEIEAELYKMRDEGLVSNGEAGIPPDVNLYWQPTPQGKRERERRWQQLSYRHQALTSSSIALGDLMLALVASGHEETDPLDDDGFDVLSLGIHLQRFPDTDIEAQLNALIAQGLVAYEPQHFGGWPQRIRLTNDGRIRYQRTVIGKLGLTPPYTILAEQSETEPPFEQVLLDPLLANNLRYRWEEAVRCKQSAAYLAASIMHGSILETVLLGVLSRHPAKANQSPKAPKRSGSVRPMAEWSLDAMLQVAADLGWIDGALYRHAQAIRDTRNLVHPSKQIEERSQPDEGLIEISERIVRKIVDSLLAAPGVMAAAP